jgi:hypothetical protein
MSRLLIRTSVSTRYSSVTYRTARTKSYDTVSHSAGAYLASAATTPDLRPRTPHSRVAAAVFLLSRAELPETPTPDSSENYPMRISTTGRYEWWTDLYDEVAEQLGEQARAGAIDASCEFTKNMLANLERAVDHPNMTEDLAEILSTPQVELEYEVRSEVRLNGRE